MVFVRSSPSFSYLVVQLHIIIYIHIEFIIYIDQLYMCHMYCMYFPVIPPPLSLHIFVRCRVPHPGLCEFGGAQWKALHSVPTFAKP